MSRRRGRSASSVSDDSQSQSFDVVPLSLGGVESSPTAAEFGAVLGDDTGGAGLAGDAGQAGDAAPHWMRVINDSLVRTFKRKRGCVVVVLRRRLCALSLELECGVESACTE